MANTVDIKWYGLGLAAFMRGEIDFVDDNIKVALTTSSFTPNQDTDEFFDDLTNEASGTGYTEGGELLGTPSVGYTAGTNVVKLDGVDFGITVTGSITARNVHIYKDTGTPGTSPLIGFGIFEVDASPADITATDGDLDIAWSADGILKVTAGA